MDRILSINETYMKNSDRKKIFEYFCEYTKKFKDPIDNKFLKKIEDNFEKYRLSDALMNIYKLVWDDFCSWLLEIIKPGYQQPIDRATFDKAIELLEKLKNDEEFYLEACYTAQNRHLEYYHESKFKI